MGQGGRAAGTGWGALSFPRPLPEAPLLEIPSPHTLGQASRDAAPARSWSLPNPDPNKSMLISTPPVRGCTRTQKERKSNQDSGVWGFMLRAQSCDACPLPPSPQLGDQGRPNTTFGATLQARGPRGQPCSPRPLTFLAIKNTSLPQMLTDLPLTETHQCGTPSC